LAEFRKAPDGQPTESILRYLANAKEELRGWQWSLRNAEDRLKSAREMVASYEDDVKLLEWQLAERLAD